MANTLQVLFDVLAFVGYAWWRDDWIGQNLEADFAAQVIGNVPLLESEERDRRIALENVDVV